MQIHQTHTRNDGAISMVYGLAMLCGLLASVFPRWSLWLGVAAVGSVTAGLTIALRTNRVRWLLSIASSVGCTSMAVLSAWFILSGSAWSWVGWVVGPACLLLPWLWSLLFRNLEVL